VAETDRVAVKTMRKSAFIMVAVIFRNKMFNLRQAIIHLMQIKQTNLTGVEAY
jgi:hypothetical protein